jgi:hypothetical protein
LILKPDEGVGAGHIHKVTDLAQLENLLPGLDTDYFMEAFVDASIVSYDGLVDGDGSLLFENSLTYGDGVLDYVHGKDTFFYVERHIPKPLMNIGRQLVRGVRHPSEIFPLRVLLRGRHVHAHRNQLPPARRGHP